MTALVCLMVLLLSACDGSRSEKNKEAAKTLGFMEDYFERTVDRSPIFQTQLGRKKDADKWDDLSEAHEIENYVNDTEAQKWLRNNIKKPLLDDNILLSYRLLEKKLDQQIRDFSFRRHDYPINQMFGYQSLIPGFMINFHQITNQKDAEDYISRLNNMKKLFVQIISGLELREREGIMPPKFVFEKVLMDCHNIIAGKPFDNSDNDSPLYADFKAKLSKLELSKDAKEHLLDEATKALIKNVKPAYQQLISKLKSQEKVATTNDGVWKLPDGEAYYKHMLNKITSTDLTAEEIHEIGLKEVERIHNEMKIIMKQVKFQGSLREFFKFMREDHQFYYPGSDEGRKRYMTESKDLIEKMKLKLDDLFITKPKADIIVKRVEPFREQSAGLAFYQRPAPDGSRPGAYYANLFDMNSMPTYQMEALAYHEGIPGHHMQIAIAQELQDIPSFRKYESYTAYIEGWGLYSEKIPKELGFYSDPYSDFGRLAMELWRACRLVVDTGIHTLQWPRQRGIDYYMDNTPNSKLEAVRMVNRHIVMPAQATAYKIGMMKILDLRKKAKEALGSKFDIREFHDKIITNGPVPLDILEQIIDTWVKSKA